MNRRKIGAAYEEAAAVFLEKNGVHILEKNFRCRQGEIDLIGRDGEYLVFFEVKYRKSADLGLPAEAVGAAKQRRICGAAKYYLYRKHLGESVPVRFDVVAVCGQRLNWYQNAFDYVGG